MLRTSWRSRVAIVALTACAAASPAGADAKVDTTTAVSALTRFADACGRDAGALWGRPLCGPVALVDPGSRSVIANRADSAGTWMRYDGAFVGQLPAGIGLANTSFDLGGTRWAMVLLPLPGDDFARIALLAHESFHRIQQDLGLWGLGPACPHLDTRDGRLWLRLELRALAVAVRTHGDSSTRAALDALVFRWERQRLFPAADSLESQLEIQEGTAEYTGDRLALAATGLGDERVARDIASFEKRRSYVRSMAYGTGPGLGLLLDRHDPGWRGRLTRGLRPAGMLGTAPDGKPPAQPARVA